MNILTFDIEEWYLYQLKGYIGKDKYLPNLNGYLNKLLDLLDKKSIQSTFFCLGALARENPLVIKNIAERGHEIGCHSDKHYWLTGLSYKEITSDTKNAVSSLEELIGKKVKSYRAPAFSITENNKWVFEVLFENGIERDSSIFPTFRDFGGFPSFSKDTPVTINYNGIFLKEFPIGMARMLKKNVAYSGGGYFRLIPYGLIKSVLQKSEYSMFYMHIRDFDKEQKRIFSKRYFKNYYGINRAYDKLCKLVAEFDFINMENADQIINWENQPVIHL